MARVSTIGLLTPGMISFAGGYIRRASEPDTIYKEPGIKGHLKRHAGLYAGVALAPASLGISVPVGALVDNVRSTGNIARAINDEPTKIPKEKKLRASHHIYKDAAAGTMAAVPFEALRRGMI